MKPYLDFCEAFKIFCEERPKGNTLSYGNSGENFQNNITESLRRCKIFEIEEETKKLLLLTTPPKDSTDINLPFPIIFLAVKLTKEELESLGLYFGYDWTDGIIIGEGQVINQHEEVCGKGLRVTCFSQKNDKAVWFDTFNTQVRFNSEEYKHNKVTYKLSPDVEKQTRKVITNFALNFLNLVNSPDIKVVEVIRGEKNEARRIKQGKPPLPSNYKVLITGTLKKYISDLTNSGGFKYHHRFWVRGHWRTLRKEERYGERTGSRIWILPYVKGKGILIDKTYEVKKV